MFAPITRTMTLTLGLISSAASPQLLADTEPSEKTTRSLELGSTSVTAQAWVPRQKTPVPTPPARPAPRPNST